MDRRRGVFGPAVRGTYELRKAFHDVLFDAPAEKQLELIRSYPELAGVATREHRLSARSVLDQAFAGLDHLTSGREYMGFDDLNRAYREKFGFPLIVAVRENTKETILRAGQARLGQLADRRAGNGAGRDREDRQPTSAGLGRGS